MQNQRQTEKLYDISKVEVFLKFSGKFLKTNSKVYSYNSIYLQLYFTRKVRSFYFTKGSTAWDLFQLKLVEGIRGKVKFLK